jgi:hypothetical protein
MCIDHNTMKNSLLFVMLLCSNYYVLAQDSAAVYTSYTTVEKRAATHRNIINNSITKNLSLTLTADTEENWEDAFYSMALINYRTLWIDNRIKTAFDSIGYRTPEFQRSLIEMIYTVYPNDFNEEVFQLARTTLSTKVFAMCSEFLIKQHDYNAAAILILAITHKGMIDANMIPGDTAANKAILKMLELSITKPDFKKTGKLIKKITAPGYLPGNTVIYSFQRHNRNYPGIVMVRNGNGDLIRNDDSTVFSVPQLARSVSNMPFYLTNGNTPQGIFRVNGTAVSKSMAIGPTTNIQLLMPYETTPQFFLKDSSVIDTIWNEALYQRVLPGGWKNEQALYQSFYASKIGRTEIIAHGTTVDPDFYKGQSYYPQTPTQGCLCTKEIWDATGKRTISDQQKLIGAFNKAGDTNGYLIVIEVDDQQKEVTPEEILHLLN